MKKSLTALLLFLSVITRAQNSDSTYRFSIKQAIDFSFEHQTDVVNAAIDVDVARTQVNEITGMGLPQLNASFDLKDYVEIPTSLIPADFLVAHREAMPRLSSVLSIMQRQVFPLHN